MTGPSVTLRVTADASAALAEIDALNAKVLDLVAALDRLAERGVKLTISVDREPAPDTRAVARGDYGDPR